MCPQFPPIGDRDVTVHVQVPKMQELVVSSAVTLAEDESVLMTIPQVNTRPLLHNSNGDETVTLIVALSPSIVEPARQICPDFTAKSHSYRYRSLAWSIMYRNI